MAPLIPFTPSTPYKHTLHQPTPFNYISHTHSPTPAASLHRPAAIISSVTPPAVSEKALRSVAVTSSWSNTSSARIFRKTVGLKRALGREGEVPH